jgi:hypothetical protein
LVQKRTLAFVTLATIVWAALTSAFAGYYYLQNRNNTERLDNAQNSLNKVASNYSEVTGRYDLLLSEYASLYGIYSYDTSNATFSNYATLMPALRSLIANFGRNYTNLFFQADINATYHQLLDDYEKCLQEGNVTEGNFENLLSEYYTLFNLSALRELGLSVSEASTLSVNISIDYGNATVKWFNDTKVSAGYTLFELTEETAVTKYSYFASSGPGHVLVDSINGVSPSGGYYWFWYYWSKSDKRWMLGSLGCDAWLLEDGGTYEWKYEPYL